MNVAPSLRSCPPRGLSALKRLGLRFGRNQQGATAVEFGLVALPFFGLLFVTIQIALVMLSTQILETAVAAAARQLYTGEFQKNSANSGLTAALLQANFKTLVCNNVSGFFDCAALVDVDVRTFSGFPSATVTSPNVGGVYDATGYTYQTPARNDIVVVRASMQYPNYASFFAPATALNNGSQLVMATTAFRAEPF